MSINSSYLPGFDQSSFPSQVKQLSDINWKEHVSSSWQNKKIENETQAFEPDKIVTTIKEFIEGHPDCLKDKATVENLLKIEFQAEQVGVDTKELHKLILNAPVDNLDEVEIQEKHNDSNVLLSKRFPRLSLTLRYPYFRGMLDAFKEKQTKVIKIQVEDDEVPGHFLSTLEKEPDIHADNVMSYLKIADKYQFEHLKDKCEKWLLDNISQDQQLELLQSIDSYNAPLLKVKLAERILEQLVLQETSDFYYALETKSSWSLSLIERGKTLITYIKNSYGVKEEPKGPSVKEFLTQYGQFITQFNPPVKPSQPLQKDLIRDIVNHCPNLQSINLAYTSRIAEEDVKNLVEKCPLIQSINLEGCDTLTDEALNLISNHYPSLQSINLDGCDQLTDQAIMDLAQGCRQLKSIDLSSCDGLSVKAIDILAGFCPSLESVQLCHLQGINFFSIKNLVEKCSKLKEINLVGAKGEREQDILAILKFIPAHDPSIRIIRNIFMTR